MWNNLTAHRVGRGRQCLRQLSSFCLFICLLHSVLAWSFKRKVEFEIIFKRKRQCYKNQWVILNWVSSSTVKVKIANIKCTIRNRNLGHVIPFLSHWQNGSLTPEPLQRVSSFTLLKKTSNDTTNKGFSYRYEIQNI